MQRRGLFRNLAILAIVILAFCVPWQSRIHAPATLRSAEELYLFPSEPGRLISVALNSGATVEADQTLFTLEVPEIEEERLVANARLRVIETRLKRIAADREDRSQSGVLLRQRESERRRLAGLENRLAKLQYKAPFAGTLANLDPQLHEGQWLSGDRPLAMLKQEGIVRLEALVSEEDLTRLQRGSAAKFIPEGLFEPAIPAVLTHISTTSRAELNDPVYDAANGGPVATRPDPESGASLTIEPLYRVTLEPVDRLPPGSSKRLKLGTVVIEGEARSLASTLFNRVVSVLIRESGF